MKKLSSLSIFFPCLNDSHVIPYLVIKSATVAKKITNDFEIIVIDDGSTDDSFETLQTMRKEYPYLKIIRHKKNLGYGKALQDGFHYSTKDFVFYTDGDGQYDVGELQLLVKKMDEKTDIVNGYKIERSDNFLRKISGSIYNSMLQFIYHPAIADIDCDFRLIRKSALNRIQLESTSGMICIELILKLMAVKARFKQVPVHHYHRLFGKSEFFRIISLHKTFKDHQLFHKSHKKNKTAFEKKQYKTIL